MESKLESLLVVSLGKARSGMPPSLCSRAERSARRVDQSDKENGGGSSGLYTSVALIIIINYDIEFTQP